MHGILIIGPYNTQQEGPNGRAGQAMAALRGGGRAWAGLYVDM